MIPEPLDSFYTALRRGDEDALMAVLDPGFRARFATGMPVGGGPVEGPAQAKERWWSIGAAYAVRADVDEVTELGDGRLLALGTYRGSRRSDGHAVEARFAHVWRVDGGRLAGLEQITDTARW